VGYKDDDSGVSVADRLAEWIDDVGLCEGEGKGESSGLVCCGSLRCGIELCCIISSEIDVSW